MTKNELNILKDKINNSNINSFTNEKENIKALKFKIDEDEKNTVNTIVNDILNENGVCDDIITVKKELNELKQTNICDDVVITGIAETENENLLETVNNLLSVQYEMVIKSDVVKSIFRLKNTKCGVNSPILLVLKSENVKRLLMDKQKINGPIILQHKNPDSINNLQKVFFKHRLTSENLSLLRDTRKFCRENSYQFVWTTNDAKILIKKSPGIRPIKITSLKDLELLKN